MEIFSCINSIHIRNSKKTLKRGQKPKEANPDWQLQILSLQVQSYWELVLMREFVQTDRIDRKVQDWFWQRLASPLALLCTEVKHALWSKNKKCCRTLWFYEKICIFWQTRRWKHGSCRTRQWWWWETKWHLPNLVIHSSRLKMDFEET